jgi:hypothetical protein
VRGRRAKIGIVSPASFLSESLMRRDKLECTFLFHPHLRVCRHRAGEGASGQRSRDNSRLPLCIQNYLLGLAGVKFGRYLLLSLPAQAAYALAFVWLGDSLTTNAGWHLLLAVAALTGVSLLVSLLRRWLNRRASGTAPSPHIR